jgi:hypothetical protein
MSNKTLSDLLVRAIQGGEEDEMYLESAPEVSVSASPTTSSPVDTEVEKVAGVLDFLGRRGVGNVMKLASACAAPEGSNEDTVPGGGGTQATLGDKERGAHHPSLSSSSAAIGYDKTEKAKQVSPSLSSLLDAAPFADPVMKQKLSPKATKHDKNIHSKTAHDSGAIRREIERRISEQGA